MTTDLKPTPHRANQSVRNERHSINLTNTIHRQQ